MGRCVYHYSLEYVSGLRRSKDFGTAIQKYEGMGPFHDNDGRSAVTDKYFIAQCFYAHSTQLLIKAADVLGKIEDVAIYTQLLQKIKEAFVKEYVTPNGRLISGTQTAYVLALNFEMLPESQRADAAKQLADNVKSYGNHL